MRSETLLDLAITALAEHLAGGRRQGALAAVKRKHTTVWLTHSDLRIQYRICLLACRIPLFR